jgi:hypothetical protein
MTNHGHHRHRGYYHRHPFFNWHEMKLYLGIAVLCFIVAGGMNFIIMKSRPVINRVQTLTSLAKQLPEGEVLNKLMNLREGGSIEGNQLPEGLKGGSGQSGDISAQAGGRLSEKDLNRAKQRYKENLSRDEIEKLKNAYNQFKGR